MTKILPNPTEMAKAMVRDFEISSIFSPNVENYYSTIIDVLQEINIHLIYLIEMLLLVLTYI